MWEVVHLHNIYVQYRLYYATQTSALKWTYCYYRYFTRVHTLFYCIPFCDLHANCLICTKHYKLYRKTISDLNGGIISVPFVLLSVVWRTGWQEIKMNLSFGERKNLEIVWWHWCIYEHFIIKFILRLVLLKWHVQTGLQWFFIVLIFKNNK
jgi:hypothetical protein